MKRFQRLVVYFGSLVFLISVFSVLRCPIEAEESTGIGMVLTIKGNVTANTQLKAGKRLVPMDVLRDGDRVMVKEGGSVTIIIYRTNKEYTLQGPAEAKVRRQGIEKFSGRVTEVSTKVAQALPQSSKIHSRRIMGVAVIGQVEHSQPAAKPVPRPPAPPRPAPAPEPAPAPVIQAHKSNEAVSAKNNSCISAEVADTSAQNHRYSVAKPEAAAKPGSATQPIADAKRVPTESSPITPPKPESLVLYPPDGGSVLFGDFAFRWKFKYKPDRIKLTLKEVQGDEKSEQLTEIFTQTVTGTDSFPCPESCRDIFTPGRKFRFYARGMYSKPPVPGLSFIEITSTFGVIREEQGNVILQARKEFDEAVTVKSSDPAPIARLMIAYMGNGLYEETVKLHGTIEKALPDNPNLYYLLAEAYEKLGMADEQKKCEQKAAEIEKTRN